MRPVTACSADLDADGDAEVLLRSPHAYAVLAPQHGGRLTHLFTRGPVGGVLVVGNPTDDWHLQRELHRYMDRPANHPGCLADRGGEHDRWAATVSSSEAGARVDLLDVEPGSPLRGTVKTCLLLPDRRALLVAYRLAPGVGELRTELCLSPDYLRLLRCAREGVVPLCDERRRGWRNGAVPTWVCLADDEDSAFEDEAAREVGHGFVVQVRARPPGFHLLLGAEEADQAACLAWLHAARADLRGEAGGARAPREDQAETDPAPAGPTGVEEAGR